MRQRKAEPQRSTSPAAIEVRSNDDEIALIQDPDPWLKGRGIAPSAQVFYGNATAER
jgi:hypothetical protein